MWTNCDRDKWNRTATNFIRVVGRANGFFKKNAMNRTWFGCMANDASHLCHLFQFHRVCCHPPLFVEESAILYFKYFFPCCQWPHLLSKFGIWIEAHHRFCMLFSNDVEGVFQILQFRLANVSREGRTPLLGGNFNACIGPVENHDYFDFYKDHAESGAETSEKPILFILFWRKDFGSAIARWLWNMCMTVLMVLWYNSISVSLVSKGSVSYLSSPCFSTIIGGIGGPALIKRRVVGVM